MLRPPTTPWQRVTRLLYGENNDVWHDPREEEETFHDARDQVEEIRVTEAINGNVTNWEIFGNCRRDPSVFLDNTQDEVRRLVTEIPGMKKVNITLICMMVRNDPKTGEQTLTDINARSKTHTIQ